MKKIVCLWLILFAFFVVKAKDEVRPELKKYFDEYNLVGTFVLYDAKAKKYIRYNTERARQRFIPASTFKIANSLIGLETGVISGEDYVFKWNGEKRSIESWNKDLKLGEAFQASCVPCYQELARNVGAEKMQKLINKIGYGNKNISGGIDRFWLTGDLRISANEQVKFLRRLYKNDLPFSDKNLAIVRKIMLREETAEYKFYGKTGWQTDDLNNAIGNYSIGWFVGYIEKNGAVYFFALNVETAKTENSFAAARIEITKKILKNLNLL